MIHEGSSGATIEINLPLETFNEDVSSDDEPPPSYELLENKWVKREWKRMGTCIFLGIYPPLITVLSILISSCLGTQMTHENHGQYVAKPSTKPVMYALVSAVVASGIAPFVACLLLILCASRIRMCTLIMAVLMEVVLCVAVLLSTVPWFIDILPFCFLFITLVSALVFRKSILYDNPHMRIGCAILRSSPLLILTVFSMFVAKILWVVFCSSVILCSINVLFPAAANAETRFLLQRDPTDVDIFMFTIIDIAVFSLWLLGAAVMTNIVRFITASYVGRWCLGEHVAQPRTSRDSIKQAFATYLGAICFGPVPNCVMETAISSGINEVCMEVQDRSVTCFIHMCDSINGYVSGLPLAYEALTGQSYSQATEGAIELFDEFSRTMHVNTTLYFYVIKVTVLFSSSVISGLVIHIFLKDLEKEDITETDAGAVFLGALLSYFLVSGMTTILKSCVSAVFTCFLIFPTELGAAHPEHYRSLTEFRNEYHRTDLVTSSGFYTLQESDDDDYL